jgi:hypothetical protein
MTVKATPEEEEEKRERPPKGTSVCHCAKLRAWYGKLNISDKVAVFTAGIHSSILIFTMAILILTIGALWYAAQQLTIAVKGTQYQNAILIIDQSSDIADRLEKEPKLLQVLENKTDDKQSIESAEKNLEAYQSLLFKAAVLEDNQLMPAEFWSTFLADFCERMYKRYPYIPGWWGRQKVREPYATLSKRYRDLSNECVPNTGGSGRVR